MNITKSLIEYGLKEKHAKVYEACLELGSASVLQISQRANCPRSTCELVLKYLQQEGFVSSFKKKKTKYFSPQDPHKIVESAKQVAIALENSLPELMSLYGSSKNRPTVRYYEGRNGIKMVFQEILEEAKETICFGSPEDIFDTLGDIWPEFVKNRIKRKIPSKVINRPTANAYQRQKTGPQELREVRIVPELPEYYSLQIIWNNKIMMLSLKQDLFAVIIESKQLADTQKALFSVIWNRA